MCKEKEMFIEALETLFFSWGSEAPEEVSWGANDLLEWYEKEFGILLNIRFEENEETGESNFEDVFEAIRNSNKEVL